MATNHPVLKFRLADVGGQETFATGWFYGNDVLGPVDIYLAAIIAAARLMLALKLSMVLS